MSLWTRRAAALLLVSALSLPLGCGGLKTATRKDRAPVPVEPWLVQLLDAMPAPPASIVSLSVMEVNIQDPFPQALDEATVERMRGAAGGQGAEVLVIERVVTPTRHAWYGFGLRKEAGGVPPTGVGSCTHPAALDALADVQTGSRQCLDALKAARPGVAGTVRAIFQVDAFGDVYRVAASPESSRDSQVRACVVDAVAAESFGDHMGFVCRLEVEVSL